MIRKSAHTHHLAVAEGVHDPEWRQLGGDSAEPSPLALIADQRHDLVTHPRTS